MVKRVNAVGTLAIVSLLLVATPAGKTVDTASHTAPVVYSTTATGGALGK